MSTNAPKSDSGLVNDNGPKSPFEALNTLFGSLDDSPDLIKDAYDKKPGETFTTKSQEQLETRKLAKALPAYAMGGFITDSTGRVFRFERAFKIGQKPVAKNEKVNLADPISTDPWTEIYGDDMKLTEITGGQESEVVDGDEKLSGPLTITSGFNIWNLPDEMKERLNLETFVNSEKKRQTKKTREALQKQLGKSKAGEGFKKGIEDFIGFLKIFGFQSMFSPPITLPLDALDLEAKIKDGMKIAAKKHESVKVKIEVPVKVKPKEKEEYLENPNNTLVLTGNKKEIDPKKLTVIRENQKHEIPMDHPEEDTRTKQKFNHNENNEFLNALILDHLPVDTPPIVIPKQKVKAQRPTHLHEGTDYGGEQYLGKPFYSVLPGKVISVAGPIMNSDSVITIASTVTINNKTKTVYHRYIHGRKIFVKPGDFVFPGSKIGEIGGVAGTMGVGSGNFPHLHFEIYTKEDGLLDGSKIVDQSKGKTLIADKKINNKQA